MHGHQAHAGLGGQERAELRQPGHRAAAGPGETDVGQLRGEAREVAGEGGGVVGTRAARHLLAAGRPVPAEAPVELGLVAQLQGVHRAAPDAVDHLSGLGGGDRAVVSLEVDAEDEPAADRRGQRVGDVHPVRRQGEAHPRRARDVRHRPPRPVGAVAPEAQHRPLLGRDVLDQVQQDRVHSVGVGAGVLLERLDLDREADEPRRDRLAHRGAADGQCRLRRRLRGAPTPTPEQADGDRHGRHGGNGDPRLWPSGAARVHGGSEGSGSRPADARIRPCGGQASGPVRR